MFLEYQTDVVSWHKSCKCSMSLFSRQQEEQFLDTKTVTMPTLPKCTHAPTYYT